MIDLHVTASDEVLPRSLSSCVGRSLALLLKSSFNHDCMRHTTPESWECQPRVCLLVLHFFSSSITSTLQMQSISSTMLKYMLLHLQCFCGGNALGILPMKLPGPVD